jgi:hypothetical protein
VQASLPGSADSQAITCERIEIGPRYFATLRIPVLRGREFDRRDTDQSPQVAIVNEVLARRFWAGGAAIGAALVVNGQPRQVVGIVKEVPRQNRGEAPLPFVYTPFWQNTAQVDAQLVLRVRGDPAVMLPALAREVNRADPDIPLAETNTLAQEIAGSENDLRVTAAFVSYAAALAVLLSAIGFYGALAFSVSRRTKEIGIRMAVGAKPAGVLGMVIREGMTVLMVGVSFGLGGAFAGARLVRHLLYGPASSDVPVYSAAVLVVAFVGLIACWVPARRAASVEPIVALREE